MDQTAGWAAGLRLAALSLREAGDVDRFLADLTGNTTAISDYLVGEVLSALPSGTAEVLRAVSICAELSAGLAGALTGRPDAGEVLASLERDTSLVLSVGDGRTAYRVHPLLRAHLLLDLRRRHPEQVAGLHAAAADWFAARGQPARALTHARQADDDARVAELLVAQGVALVASGEHAAVRDALSVLDRAGALPGVRQPIRRSRCWPRSWPPRTVHPPRCGATSPGPPRSGPSTPTWPRWSGSTGPSRWCSPGARGRLAGTSTTRWPTPGGTTAATSPPVRRACSPWSPRRTGSTGGWPSSPRPPMPSSRAGAGGRPRARGSRRCWAPTGRCSTCTPSAAWTCSPQHPPTRPTRCSARCGRRCARRHSPTCTATPRPSRSCGSPGPPWPAGYHPGWPRPRCCSRTVSPWTSPAPTSPPTWLRRAGELLGRTGELVLMAARQDASGGGALRDVLDGAVAPVVPWTVGEAHARACAAALAAGRSPLARRELEAALAAAGAGGALRPLLAGGPAVTGLLARQIGSFGAGDAVAARVLAVCDRADGADRGSSFTERERDVLGLLSSPHSLQEIATVLGVAPSTVKTHVRAIYTKLGVRSRRAAVAAGRRGGTVAVGRR